MNPHQQALHWAHQYLIKSEKSEILSQLKIVETAYSLVYKIETTKQTVYLKQVPKALFLEPTTLIFLNGKNTEHIPTLLAQNTELRCFIMTASGDISLRQRFNEAQVQKGILNYTHIQRSLESEPQALFRLDIPDWRLKAFSSLYAQLIKKEELLTVNCPNFNLTSAISPSLRIL